MTILTMSTMTIPVERNGYVSHGILYDGTGRELYIFSVHSVLRKNETITVEYPRMLDALGDLCLKLIG